MTTEKKLEPKHQVMITDMHQTLANVAAQIISNSTKLEWLAEALAGVDDSQKIHIDIPVPTVEEVSNHSISDTLNMLIKLLDLQNDTICLALSAIGYPSVKESKKSIHAVNYPFPLESIPVSLT